MAFVMITVMAFLGSFLTLFSGFGLGTLLMPVVAIFFPVAVAVALTAFVHLVNNLFKLLTLWRDIHWRVSLVFGVPALLATVPGAWLLTTLSSLPEIITYSVAGYTAILTPVKLATGVLLLFFATVELFSMAKKINVPQKYLPLGGVLSGFFGGLSGHQGAFRSAFLLHAGLTPAQFIASNAVIASFVDVTRLLVYGMNIGLLMQHMDTGLVMAATIAACAGVLAGKAGIQKVTLATIQKLVAGMLYLLGVLLVAGII